jgi:DsbC/DsbD-like thiol-disulfide interchange protein
MFVHRSGVFAGLSQQPATRADADGLDRARMIESARHVASASLTALAMLVSLALSTGAPAQLDLGRGIMEPKVSSAADAVNVRFVSDVNHIAVGETFHIAVIFDIVRHWHIYWENSGDAGGPTEIRVDAPDGFTVGETRFPRPMTIREPDGTTYGYEDQTVLFVPITAPASVDVDDATFDIRVFYLVCKDRCLMGEASGTLELPIAHAAGDVNDAAISSADRDLLERFKQRIPVPINELEHASARVDGERLIIGGAARDHETIALFPLPVPGVTFGEPQTTIADDRFEMIVPLTIKPRNARGHTLAARGVIGLGDQQHQACFRFDLPIDVAEAARR